MANELTIKITGEAGQGMQTIGAALCQMFKNTGFHIFASQDYMSRIRGGNNFFQLRISDKPLYTLRQKSDITVALDKASVAIHRSSMKDGGVLVLDKKKFTITGEDSAFLDIPFYDMATCTGGSEIFINSVACGVIAGMTGVEFHSAEQVMEATFAEKSEEVVRKNKEAARAGYDFVKNNFKQDTFWIKAGASTDTSTLVMNGNDAIALGAIRAGCKFYSAYPMTPSTSIMNVIAHYGKEFHIAVEQAEDEIAAINMIIGASFAGVRSMTATSGGGFALMVEGLSLAAMTETPIVVVVAQRPAPATGFPTRTAQADLEFVLHAGHGEFARVVYVPGTIEEAFSVTIKAFNIAEKYQVPVFLMTDQHLADSYRDIEAFDLNKVKVQRYIISKEDSKNIKDYKRYQFTESGISPRAIPSWIEDVIYADSDEHTEEGHITEDADMGRKMVEKRFYKKFSGLLQEVEKPTAYNVVGADIVLLGFGSTYGVMKEVADAIVDKKIGLIHLSQVWPFPASAMIGLLKDAKKILTVENNAGGQLARLLRRETGLQVSGSVLKYDGRPFHLDYLIDCVKKEG
ncbi:MAG: 2-oxoacid:acceptor oxidoreductase subunit alpha [Candidatus Brocadia sp. AMX2]|uniref:2-oxoglutarate ferredoxin oxidoreductase subunit alpha n=1 Tax=Candidatus Brocadia sinica JPN1 TaxID=1197129 RepID=A0ABQ0JWY4_9BACT|nr:MULTISPECIES: 2-oxoacid:acceptor oxidoreductase subunit alpha [Brocadia]MBC6931068.1 2-oxoacid:acceptor oxidoreductase subunit alpha [Candidatus Brocadia sp.]MBL1168155.1 2-oxoacid:acceptor oxidoreductase subunit alpha [Candidatus Brocadia sp. AMX1]NOG40927.1 2-oxoacid:acceptor oxidoreductase subunit alpha [Planctomycetota bacterium]GIK13104.1 MAG: 2-oxoacid:ferredoxin oxidoreductase subunit alpha [Candidatus Brocadia sinica]MCE7865743.1 2-oxoacid:acceptor oxidoreductase subunit alpha [Cand